MKCRCAGDFSYYCFLFLFVLCFLLTWNAFISHSFLKHIFFWMRVLAWQSFHFVLQKFDPWFSGLHCIWCENTIFQVIFVLLTAFKILSFWFSSRFVLMGLVILFVFILLVVHQTFWNFKIKSFPKLGMFLTIILVMFILADRLDPNCKLFHLQWVVLQIVVQSFILKDNNFDYFPPCMHCPRVNQRFG